jgi:hypothetical protein
MMDPNQSHTPDTLSPGTTSAHPASHIPITYFGISVKRLVCLFILTLGLCFIGFIKTGKLLKKQISLIFLLFGEASLAYFFAINSLNI